MYPSKPAKMSLKEGQICFAHLKGYKPSAAVVVQDKGARFLVKWLESDKVSSVLKTKIWEVNEKTIVKFVTNSAVKDKRFMKGIEKLVSLFGVKSTLLERVAELNGDNPILSITVRDSGAGTIEGEETESSLIDESVEEVAEGREEVPGESQEGKSGEGTEVTADVDGHLSEIATPDSINTPVVPDLINEGVGELHRNTKEKKKSKGKPTKGRSTAQTLKEDEAATLKKFHEKISEVADGYMCRDCDFSSGFKVSAKNHALTCGKSVRRNIRNKRHNCSMCEETFPSKAKRKEHYKLVHAHHYDCSKCEKKFKNKKQFLKHYRLHDTKYVKNYKCEHCDFRAKDMWAMRRHMSKHVEVDCQFKCDACDLSFADNYHLRRHQDRQHNNTTVDVEVLSIEATIGGISSVFFKYKVVDSVPNTADIFENVTDIGEEELENLSKQTKNDELVVKYDEINGDEITVFWKEEVELQLSGPANGNLASENWEKKLIDLRDNIVSSTSSSAIPTPSDSIQVIFAN